MKIDFANLQLQYQAYKKEIDTNIQNVLNKSNYILGEEVQTLEQELQKFTGAKYAITCSSGTDALLLALMAIDIEPGDEVITTSNTAVPTVSAIVETGADPVFCDIYESTYNINVELIESLITKKTKAIVGVHLYGHPIKIDAIKNICKKYNLKLIEDCAQSHGAKYLNKKTGSFGEISAFSFYPTKILGGYGDGGMCLTNSKIFYEKLKKLRFYGMEQTYFSKIDGVNSRLDEVQAALLDYKLKKLNSYINKRRKIAKNYNEGLNSNDLVLPEEKENYFHSYYLYVVRHKNRDKIIDKLTKENIFVNISYPWPIHTMPPYKEFKRTEMKVTNKFSKEIFSLPMYPELDLRKQERVIEVLNKVS